MKDNAAAFHIAPYPLTMPQSDLIWRISPERRLTFNEPRLIGVINVTPDSFSDGGMLKTVDDAVAHALDLVEQGACVIDVGGESTRPGSERVRAGEQIRRTRPVIAELRARSDAAISIDTTLLPVAEAALDAGADIINDVSAGREDERILDLAAERSCGLILMHRLAPPDEDR
ncbi:MAG: dihydropteroate synthase, partial [Phycisphaerales bacterium]